MTDDPAIPPADPKCQYTQEVRFAIVMYGGVSLAIYINGVAQEMYHLVRATAPADSENPDAPLLSDKQLSGTERVYRKLGQLLTGQQSSRLGVNESDPIRTRFIVDILSGTSAGGINAIFLAKALANNQPMDDLKQLWVDEGDIGLLLNDKESVKREPLLALQDEPTSLLNSTRMYVKLLKAFDDMEKAKPSFSARRSPYTNELELFVTTTDIQGVSLPLRLADMVVYERRHKNVFRFKYFDTTAGNPSQTDFAVAAKNSNVFIRNDFGQEFNPFLAFAARCTSSFPFAFEPMRLADIDEVVNQIESHHGSVSDSKTWDRFIENYQSVAGSATLPFPDRSFGDGGYLDNKPFSYAIDALTNRQTTVPVDRKLIYVEPAPDHPENVRNISARPDALQNVTAAVLVLPRYETIREDLQRVLQRNSLVERINRITRGITDDVRHALSGKRVEPKSGPNWATQDLAEMIKQKGIAYGGYQRLKVGAVTDEIAELIARASGLDADSDQLLGIRYLVRAWRGKNYTVYLDGDKQKSGMATENKFLLDFDFDYRIRRLTYVQGKLDVLYGGGPDAQKVFDDVDIDMDLTEKNVQAFREELSAIRLKLNGAFGRLSAARRALLARLDKHPLHELVVGTGITTEQIKNLLDELTDDARLKKARSLLAEQNLEQNLSILAKALAEYILDANRFSAEICKKALEPQKKDSPANKARECLWQYYQYYDDYDMIMFPILYSTGTGELDTVEIIRISPEDATSLIDERKERSKPHGRHKLAGTVLANFGAFLDRVWRQNDILWGRLDGAERIITALLPGPEYASIRTKLIEQAQEAVLKEELKPHDRLEICKVLAETIARSEPAEESAIVLRQIVDNAYGDSLDTKVQAVFRMLLTEENLLKYFKDGYEVDRQPDSEAMLKTMSRATRIIGRMLEEMSGRRNINPSRVAWIARFGQIFWSLVIVAVPGSLANLVIRHWFKVLYTFEVLLLLTGTLLTVSPMQQLGLTLFGITAGVHLLIALLGDKMRERHGLLKIAAGLIVVATLFFAALGADTVFHFGFRELLSGIYTTVGVWFISLLHWIGEAFGSQTLFMRILLWTATGAVFVFTVMGIDAVFSLGLRRKIVRMFQKRRNNEN